MAHPISSPATAGSNATPGPAARWTLPLLTGLIWVAAAWAIPRLGLSASTDLAVVTAAILAFAAVSELVRAVTARGTRLPHAALGVLATAGAAAVVLVPATHTVDWLAGMLGGYLMAKGAVDLAAALAIRSDAAARAALGLIGIAALTVGFLASAGLVDSAGDLLLLAGAFALGHAVSDIAGACHTRGATGQQSGTDSAAAGYAAGQADFRAANRRLSGPGIGRHSAAEDDDYSAPIPIFAATAGSQLAAAGTGATRGTPTGAGGPSGGMAGGGMAGAGTSGAAGPPMGPGAEPAPGRSRPGASTR